MFKPLIGKGLISSWPKQFAFCYIILKLSLRTSSTNLEQVGWQIVYIISFLDPKEIEWFKKKQSLGLDFPNVGF